MGCLACQFMEWYVSARFFHRWLRSSLGGSVFCSNALWFEKKEKMAPILAIAITLTQRVFAFYVFFPSIAIPIPIIWSLVIIYFAVKDIKTSKIL
jgi:hypothetical protein